MPNQYGNLSANDQSRLQAGDSFDNSVTTTRIDESTSTTNTANISTSNTSSTNTKNTSNSHNSQDNRIYHNPTFNHGICSHAASPDQSQAQEKEKELNEALLKAATEGQAERVDHLIGRGANADFKNGLGLTALHYACAGGHQETVEALLRHFVDINPYSKRSGTPLCLAARYAQRAIVEILLHKKANVHAPGGGYGSAVHAACVGGNGDIVKILLQKGANPSATAVVQEDRIILGAAKDSRRRCQPIHVAAIFNEADIVRQLLKAQVDVNAQSTWWKVKPKNGSSEHHKPVGTLTSTAHITPLMLSALWHCPDTAALLHRRGADLHARDSKGNTAITYALLRPDAGFIAALKQLGADIEGANNDGQTALLYATSRNCPKAVEILLQSGADKEKCDTAGQSALGIAVINGYVECLTTLLKHGADVESQIPGDWSPLMAAIRTGNEAAVNALLSHGANVQGTHGDWKPLRYACRYGNESIVREILARHANVEGAVSEDSWTSLMVACDFGHVAVVKILLQHGANAHATLKGWTSLCVAINKNNETIVKLLLAHKANVNGSSDDQSPAPWRMAIDGGHDSLLRLLLQNKAEINTRRGGWTALTHAAYNNKATAVQILLEHGANLEAVTDNDCTALICASQQGHTNIVKILLKAGASILPTNDKKYTALATARGQGHAEVVKELEHARAERMQLSTDLSQIPEPVTSRRFQRPSSSDSTITTNSATTLPLRSRRLQNFERQLSSTDTKSDSGLNVRSTVPRPRPNLSSPTNSAAASPAGWRRPRRKPRKQSKTWDPDD